VIISGLYNRDEECVCCALNYIKRIINNHAKKTKLCSKRVIGFIWLQGQTSVNA
jgi:hypothetical protein